MPTASGSLSTLGEKKPLSNENTKAALAKKKAAGVKLGTPSKRQAQIEQLRRLQGGGLSNYAISKAMGISASTVAKYVS